MTRASPWALPPGPAGRAGCSRASRGPASCAGRAFGGAQNNNNNDNNNKHHHHNNNNHDNKLNMMTIMLIIVQ